MTYMMSKTEWSFGQSVKIFKTGRNEWSHHIIAFIPNSSLNPLQKVCIITAMLVIGYCCIVIFFVVTPFLFSD